MPLEKITSYGHSRSEQKWPARIIAGCGSNSGIVCGVMEAEGHRIRSVFVLGRVIGRSVGGRCADEEMIHSSIVTRRRETDQRWLFPC